MDWGIAYRERVPALEDIRTEIDTVLNELLREYPRLDKIDVRVKSEDRFVEKANRADPQTGVRKYEYPLEEIQDQIGARIVVYYLSDIVPVVDIILSEFREIENRRIEQPDPNRFEYEARHLVCLIPTHITAKVSSPVDFFEIQVSTLFQHAWAEANHDLGYKSQQELPYEEKRQLAWAASQAWGADRIFDEIWRKLTSSS